MHALGLELRDIEVTQHRKYATTAELVASLMLLNIGSERILLTPHYRDVLTHEHIALYEQETIGQELKELLHRHHVAVRAPAVDLCMWLMLVGEGCKRGIKVYHLTMGVVYYLH